MTGSPADGRIAAARSYLDALVSHDAHDVPFDPKVVRIEAGVKTGFSGAHLRRSLERGPQYRLIAAIRDLSWSSEGDVVRCRYRLDTNLFGQNLVVAAIDERFTFRDGMICRIVADIAPKPGPDAHRLWQWLRSRAGRR